MSYPVKPWEMASASPGPVNGVNTNPSAHYVPNTDRLHSTAIPFPGSGGGGCAATNVTAPPVPPRPNQTRPIYSAYNRGSMMPYSYSSPYSSFGYSNPYSGYSSLNHGYGSYSPLNHGYGSYGSGNFYGGRSHGEPGDDLTFSQLAEESSASAFQSIESFVSAFGSVSMMLESTFHALYSSFRAVIGVADHLSRVKQIFSALAIFRFFKWTWRKIMYLIGISKIKPETVDSLWTEASERLQEADNLQNIFLRDDINKPSSSWPILMFLGFIFAGPYLMWKLVKSLNLDGSQSGMNRAWATGESEHFVAEVRFAFEASSERELNLKQGQTIRLAPSKFQPSNVRGWALASNGSNIGLVPLNYIKVLGKRTRTGLHHLKDEGQISKVDYQTRDIQSRPRVRFDLNPRPSASDTCPTESTSKLVEPPGILVRNDSNSSKDISNSVNE